MNQNNRPVKLCNKCKLILSHDQFYKNKKGKYGLHGQCKKCRNEVIQIYRQANKEKIQENAKKHRQDNKEKIREYNKKYRHDNKIGIQEKLQKHRKDNPGYSKEYRLKNLKKTQGYFRQYTYEQRKNNPKYRLNHNISRSIQKSLKIQNLLKNYRHWESLINFTLQELMDHLEGLFQFGMTWKNYGKWHIDHRKPINFFNFQIVNDSEFKECWALNNLQPLWAEDNFRKGNKYK